ncbi:MAG: beta-lactamase family protein [Rhodospirillales bacterium]|nr:beta-lactamase family protein [Rhodospirillales bacterium]
MTYARPSPTAREHAIMEGFPPPPEQRISLESWDRYPFNRWSFQNVRAVLPTRAVRHDPIRVHTLPQAPIDLASVEVPLPGGNRILLDVLLAATDTDGCIAIKDGTIRFETYLNGMTDASLHLSQSVSKSLAGALVGIQIGRGIIDPESPVERYVPELARCGYAGARVTDLLDMRSGVRFVEDYLDPDCEMGLLDRASGWKPAKPDDPGGIYDLVLRLRQDRPHGGRFQYRSIETDVLGWILERSSGRHFCTLMEETLWAPMGAEADAAYTVDRAGTALADGGLNATLRDYARFGLLMLEDGRREGSGIVPSEFVAECRRGDPSVFDEAERFPRFPAACYARQWWVLDQARGITAALGIFGQMIYLDRSSGLVMVFLSSWPAPVDPERRDLQFAAAQAVAAALGSG